MKRLLLVLISSAALTAWGQTGLAQDKSSVANDANPHPTVIVQGTDGITHELEVPDLRMMLARDFQAGCPVRIVDCLLYTSRCV